MQELGNIFFSPLLLILLFFHLANIDFPLPLACLQKTGRRVSMPQSRPCRWARCYRPLCHPRRKQSSLRWDPGVHSGLCLVLTQSLLDSCFADVRGRSGAGNGQREGERKKEKQSHCASNNKLGIRRRGRRAHHNSEFYVLFVSFRHSRCTGCEVRLHPP